MSSLIYKMKQTSFDLIYIVFKWLLWKKIWIGVSEQCVCFCVFVGISPSSSQEEQTQSHVMSHVEAVVHLATGSLVEEATKLQDLQVAGA